MTALNVAIIPAREGSKRLPGKNIKLLCGKPLIAWTIEAAITSNLFDIVLVTTDSDEIASIARAAGASVPFIRPTALSTDTASTNDVIRHAVEWIEKHLNKVSRITLLQPTSPLRTAENIMQAMRMYDTKQASAIVSVCQMEHPIQFCNTLPDNLSMVNFIKPSNNKRSQELESYWRLNGAIYIFDRKSVSNIANIYQEKTFAYIMKRENSVDIDNEFDFILAEIILSRRV